MKACAEHKIPQMVYCFRRGNALLIKTISTNPIDNAGAAVIAKILNDATESPMVQSLIKSAMQEAIGQQRSLLHAMSEEIETWWATPSKTDVPPST
jgi:hypothetical protein